jgi:hypothetical protein
MLVISRHLRQIFRLHMEKPPPFRTFLRPLKTAGPVNECAPGFLDSDRAHNNSQQHPGRCVHISGIHPRLPFHVARRNPALKTVDCPHVEILLISQLASPRSSKLPRTVDAFILARRLDVKMLPVPC